MLQEGLKCSLRSSRTPSLSLLTTHLILCYQSASKQGHPQKKQDLLWLELFLHSSMAAVELPSAEALTSLAASTSGLHKSSCKNIALAQAENRVDEEMGATAEDDL